MRPRRIVTLGEPHGQKARALRLNGITAFMFSIKQTYLAQSAFGKARQGLDKIGKKTGFGPAQPAGEVGLYDKIAGFINIALGLVGILASIYILYSGFRWMRAGGNEQEIKAAKDGLKNAIIGLVIIFLAYIIVNYVVTAVIQVISPAPPPPVT